MVVLVGTIDKVSNIDHFSAYQDSEKPASGTFPESTQVSVAE
jgi:hypothetical protein